MRPFGLLAALLLALAPIARAADRDVRRVFPVAPGCTLKIDTYRGNITVRTAEDPEVRIKVHVESTADTEQQARWLEEALDLEFEAVDNVVTVRARNPRETGARVVVDDEARLTLHFEISVPARCNLELRARDGALIVEPLAGRMNVDVEQGSVFFRRVEGSIAARMGQGDLVVSRCSGDVGATVRRGLIRLGTIAGNVTVKNSSGDVEVMTARAGVSIDAEAGEVSIGFAHPATADARVAVSGGSIRARFDPAAACTLEATTTAFGRVTSKLALEIDENELGARRLRGRMNGGGRKLTLRASGGNILLTPDLVDLDRPRN